MKCPKCGFNSFDYLESCKKCGNDLKQFKSRHNLRSLLFPFREKGKIPAAAALAVAKPQEADFDYGFMDEDTDGAAAVAASAPVESGGQDDPFELDWNEQTEPEPAVQARVAPDVEAASGGADAFDFDTDSELDDLLQNEESVAVEDFAAAQPAEEQPLDVGLQEDSWDDEALGDLSVGEELPALDELSADLPDLDAFGEGGTRDLDLPDLDDLDFEGLGDLGESPRAQAQDTEAADAGGADWGEIDFGEDADVEAPDKPPRSDKNKGPKGELPDPFEQPESAAAGQAPETLESAVQQQEFAMARTSKPQDTLNLPLHASAVARLGAFWLDLFLVVGAFLLFLVSATRLLAPPGASGLLPALHEVVSLSLPYYLLLFLVCFGYFTAFHFFIGQTLGKMLFGLRLEGSNGRELLLSEAFLHSVGGLMSLLSLGAGFLLALRHPEGRGWNDRLAGTRVVALRAED